MNSFDNIQALANRLKELSSLLSSSKINETELQEFEDIARTLYERGLILNYKAKEEKVYQKKSASIEIEKEEKIEEIGRASCRERVYIADIAINLHNIVR